MRFVFLVSGIFLVGWIAHLILPWYAILLIAFPFGILISVREWQSFLAGFLAGFMLWGINAGYMNLQNDGLLAGRMGELMGGMGPAWMVALTALLGGLLAGMGSLCGNLGRAVFN